MLKSRLPVCWILLLLLAPIVTQAQLRVRELSRTASSVTLDVTLPAPAFDTTANSELTLRHFAEQTSSDDPLASILLPVRLSRSASVAILSHDDRTIELKHALTRRSSFKAVHRSIGFAQISYAGKLRASDISTLEIGAFDQVSPTALKYVSRVILKISDGSGLPQSSVTDLTEPYHVPTSIFRQRLAASAPARGMPARGMPARGIHALSDSDVQQSPGIQAEDGNVHRMYVRRAGIYHLTFADLVSYGLDPHTIDPGTLRIVNRGQQIPLFLFDHQDGHFDENDYFEFYGEEKHYDGPGTLGDFYYDPDTKDNVYFLVWGTHYSPLPAGGVKRMVEESGDIRTIDPKQVVNLRDSAYWALMHVEQNNIHEDLDISDVDQRSDLRDHDFMAIIGTGSLYPGSYTTKALIPFADVRENKPISVRAALHGVSHFDPGSTDSKGVELPNVSDEDVASVSVNNHEVLHGTWDSQTLKILTTDSASQLTAGVIPTAQYLGSEVLPIDLTVSQRKQTDVIGCRFAVNWIEIGYNRKYQAYQDSITFRVPRGDGSALYQFTLENFSRTDVSVYRKGVSRISNVVITSNPDVPRSTKAIFQLHVASDHDEFIAVTEAGKLKPYKVVSDDFASLRSPANAGQYLIITNRDHLSKTHGGARVPLMDLADYRAATNHVSTRIVDVASIYDEFHYGARSANAIKSFLNYAYHNWQDPPKYVLLVGVTHMGDGDPKQYLPNDQVPAPYIQAYLEGNVSADAWYTMLDGDGDLIPDILLGRLATLDVAGDGAYLAKLRDYEGDLTKPGDWKNKAYFIGAGGSFDTDIDGVIRDGLPHRVSAQRQTTVRSSPYHGTDKTLVDAVNNGVTFLGYFGHGGNAIWDDPLDSTGRPILDNSDISRFHNFGRYPVILSMTCFTAGYDGSSIGILNTFQNAKNAGSIACMGTTSFGWQQNDQHLALSVVPRLFDTIGGTLAERIYSGKIDFMLRALSGDLIPPTLMYAYHFLGDPLAPAHPPSERVSLNVGTRTIATNASVQLSGTSSLQNGTANMELVNEKLSPLAPPHVISATISNGAFSATDNVPNVTMPNAMYRVTVSESGSARYGATSEDVTITDSRVTEVAFTPHPLPVGATVDLSAAVQTPQSIVGVFDTITIYSQNAGGQITSRTLTQAMTQSGDKYHATIAASDVAAGDKLVARVALVTSAGTTLSDTAYVIVGAAADPAVSRDIAHRSLYGRYIATPSGLAWQDKVYNAGASQIGSATVSLLDLKTNSVLGNTVITNLAPHTETTVTIPLTVTSIDSALYALAISPDAGNGPLNLRDSITTNDTTLAAPLAGAVAYRKGQGANATLSEISLIMPGTAESNVAADVLRVGRRYDSIVTGQPDIHFLPLLSDRGNRYSALNVVSDSLGAIALASSASLTLNISDSLASLYANKLFVYRQDDRTKEWTQLATKQTGHTLTATVTNLGSFAVAYHTDSKDPVIDMTVEGQLFAQHGEVPPTPRIQAVLQDANGMDIRPGKTIVTLDGKVSDYTMLDSGRTTTTVNLRLSPSLSEGEHTIAVRGTDNNGRTASDSIIVHVSHSFSIGVLGTFPNPFTKEYMFLAYEIRGIAFATQVSLDIYTVAGRRIRTMTFPSTDPTRSFGFLKGGTGVPTSLGYHEVWWDGRDDNGDEAANGVYYYRFTTETPSDSKEIKGKFARIR